MKKLFQIIAAVLLGTVSVSPVKADEGQLASTMLGAGLGGWAGSYIGHGSGRLAATGAGVFIGGALGHELGRPEAQPVSYSYDMFSHATYPQYYYPYDMFPTHQDMPYYPTYVAPPELPPAPVTYVDGDSGQYCREYSQRTRIGNQVQESFGTACLQPDGSWHIVE